ncbi:MAG: hypothetical protein LBR79_07055 [Oscillospiraceae bacterium]|nr:hypothetical protein [Oscillospiraceae bacterium]
MMRGKTEAEATDIANNYAETYQRIYGEAIANGKNPLLAEIFADLIALGFPVARAIMFANTYEVVEASGNTEAYAYAYKYEQMIFEGLFPKMADEIAIVYADRKTAGHSRLESSLYAEVYVPIMKHVLAIDSAHDATDSADDAADRAYNVTNSAHVYATAYVTAVTQPHSKIWSASYAYWFIIMNERSPTQCKAHADAFEAALEAAHAGNVNNINDLLNLIEAVIVSAHSAQ